MKKLTITTLALALGAGMVLAGAPTAEAAALHTKALSVAAEQKNDPYQYGAAGPNAFDCSGLVKYSFGKAGKTLPRTAQAQYNASQHIPWGNRQPGDIVAFGTSQGRITHVGIYAGYWNGTAWLWNANTGSYRGRKVVLAPVNEYLGGGRTAYYGRY